MVLMVTNGFIDSNSEMDVLYVEKCEVCIGWRLNEQMRDYFKVGAF